MSRAEWMIDGEKRIVRGELRSERLTAEIDNGSRLEGQFHPTGPGEGVWQVNGKRHHILTAEHKGQVWVAVDGRIFQFRQASDDDLAGAHASENMIAAPMPGKVIKLFANVGDHVTEGQPVLIVEAMKMEHTLRAPMAGKIVTLKCSEGQQVDANVPLVEFEENGGD